MKKLTAKLRRQPNETESRQRITNDTLAEHRERVLASGRRFKYPLQYARHRLVFNAIIIGVSALILLAALIWSQLYWAQNTSDFIYRVTRVLPVPVAYVDGQPVLYSDYLMRLRSGMHYLETKQQVNLSTPDGKRQVDYEKQQDMQKVITMAYATKLAHQKNISVSDTELQSYLDAQRQSSDGTASQETSDAVILDYYGWTPSEYRHILSQALLLQKISFAVDDKASNLAQQVGQAVSQPNADFKAIVDSINKTSDVKLSYGQSGAVPKTNQDGGLATAAAKLQKGQISGQIKSTNGNGYYYLRVLDINDTQVNYEYVQVPLTTLDAKVAALQKAHKVKEFITVPKVAQATK